MNYNSLEWGKFVRTGSGEEIFDSLDLIVCFFQSWQEADIISHLKQKRSQAIDLHKP